MTTFQAAVHIAAIGIGATLVLDAWLGLARLLGVPTSSFALIGRWVGHFARGRFTHRSIASAERVPRELALGWLTHYVVGIAFAGILVAGQGIGWVLQPSFVPALATGVATVVVPLFVMQPAMGSGFAALKTPTPLKNCLRSLVNHAVFGAGMYLAAVALNWAAG